MRCPNQEGGGTSSRSDGGVSSCLDVVLGRIVEAPGLNSTSEKRLLTGPVTRGARAVVPVIKLFGVLVKRLNGYCITSRRIDAIGARTVVAGIGVGQSLRISFIVMVIAVRVKARRRCAITDVISEKSRGGRSGAFWKAASLLRRRSGDNRGRAGGETKRSARTAYKCHAASRTGSRRMHANAKVSNVPWIRKRRGREDCQVCNRRVVQ